MHHFAKVIPPLPPSLPPSNTRSLIFQVHTIEKANNLGGGVLTGARQHLALSVCWCVYPVSERRHHGDDEAVEERTLVLDRASVCVGGGLAACGGK